MKKVLIFELFTIFFFFPTLFIVEILPKNYMFLTLWAGCFYAIYHIKKANLKLFNGFKFDEFKFIFKRFLILAFFMGIFTLIFFKTKFFIFTKRAH